MIPFIDLQAQRQRIAPAIDAAIQKVLAHGQYIMGPEVGELESALADFCGARHAISCANGTDALGLALRAIDVGEGDAVFVPSFTFVATAEAVALVGATPVFVDVCDDTFNMCLESLAAAIEAVQKDGALMPKAVIPVDLFGQPARYPKINALAEAYGLTVIADAAQSFGAQLDNTPVGRLATLSTTSFFPAKPFGCYGDGGAVFTDDDELASLMRSIRNHGQGRDRYDNIRLGLNSRLDSVQAAILLEKLKIFPDEVEARDRIAARYRKNLPAGVRAQSVSPGVRSVWAQYTLVAEDRDGIRKRLSAREIPTAVYYPRPIHLQLPYEHAPCAPSGLPVTEYLRNRVFSLPMHPYLDAPTQDRVIAALTEAVAG